MPFLLDPGYQAVWEQNINSNADNTFGHTVPTETLVGEFCQNLWQKKNLLSIFTY